MVTEQAGKACRRARRFFRCQFQRVQADEHDRAVDQEADNNHTCHIDAGIACRGQPVNHSRDGDLRHKEHPGGTAVAFEHRVRHPTAQQRADLGAPEKALYSRNHVDIPLRAQQVVLASGSFFNNGLVAAFDRVVEPVFGLDVYYAAKRSDWSREQVLAPQPYRVFGVKTDEKLRPRIKGGTVPGVYAIGALLAGFDPLAQGCGAGVSLLSALSVADTLLQGEVA